MSQIIHWCTRQCTHFLPQRIFVCWLSVTSADCVSGTKHYCTAVGNLAVKVTNLFCCCSFCSCFLRVVLHICSIVGVQSVCMCVCVCVYFCCCYICMDYWTGMSHAWTCLYWVVFSFNTLNISSGAFTHDGKRHLSFKEEEEEKNIKRKDSCHSNRTIAVQYFGRGPPFV